MNNVKILREEIENVPDDRVLEIRNAIDDLTKAYTKENLGRVRVDFELPQNRIAYIYKYKEQHAQVTRMALRLIETAIDDPQVRNFFDDLQSKETVVVTSIGGGPGSDLEGFYRFWSTDTEFKKPNFKLANLDLYDGWRECFKGFMNLLKLQPDNYNFLRANVLEQNDVVQEQLQNSDLVIMCRFLSAVYHSDGLQKNIMRMLRNMKSGAHLLIVDNMYRSWGCNTLDWMQYDTPQKKFSLIHNYGSADGSVITLDDDLRNEIYGQCIDYRQAFPYLPYLQEGALQGPKGIGLQLWQRV